MKNPYLFRKHRNVVKFLNVTQYSDWSHTSASLYYLDNKKRSCVHSLAKVLPLSSVLPTHSDIVNAGTRILGTFVWKYAYLIHYLGTYY